MRGNRYVSFLATEIEPKAFTTLSKFEQATENAFDRIARFNNSGAAKLGINVDQRSIRSLATAQASLNQTRTQAERMSPALRTVARDSNAMATSLERSAQSLTVVQGALGPVAGRLAALGGIFRNLSGLALTGVLGGAGAFAIAGIASDYQRVTDRLRPFYETQQQTNGAMKEVIAIARDTRQALDPVAALYSRLGQAAKDANLNIDQSAVTRTVARAARLSGGDAQTQQAGITQFLQGFGSGTLNGDELKSIRENTFRLAKALADGLGVPIAKLKQLGAEGKLTPAIISEALKRSAAVIDLEFSRLPIRIDQALQGASNNLSVFIGRVDEATGATSNIAKAIQGIGNNLDATAAAMAGFLALYTSRKLAAPLDAIAAATQRRSTITRQAAELDRQAAMAANQIGPQRTSPAGNIVRSRAAQAAADANAAVAGANEERRAREANVIAIEKEAAATASRRAALRTEAAAIRETAAAKLQAAQTRVNAATGGVSAGRDIAVGSAAATSEANRAAVTAARTRIYLAQQEVDAARAAGVQLRDVEKASQAQRLAQAEAAARQRVAVARAEVADITAARSAAERRAAAAALPGANGAADPNLSRATRAKIVATNARLEAIATAEATAKTQEQTIATQRLAAAEAELAAARRASRAGPGGGGTTEREVVATNALTAAKEQLIAAQATLNAQSAAYPVEASISSTQRLAGAQAQLSAARAEAAAATRAAAAIEEQANVTGFKRLTIIQQQIAAEQARIAALANVASAETAVAVATINATYAQRVSATTTGVLAGVTNALSVAATIAGGGMRGLGAAIGVATAAKIAATRAAAGLQAALTAMSGVLGGPVGIAITAATVGLTYLALRTDEAAAAAERFRQKQQEAVNDVNTLTDAFRRQGEQAQRLALDTASLGISQAEQRKKDISKQVAGSLGVARSYLPLIKTNEQDQKDADLLESLFDKGQAGNLTVRDYGVVAKLRRRRPELFQNDRLAGLTGSNPGKITEQFQGLYQAEGEVDEAKMSARRTVAAFRASRKPLPDLLGSGGKPRLTVEQLKAYAADEAEGGTKLADARAKYNRTVADLDAKLKEKRDAGDFSFDDEYRAQLKAARTELNAVGDAQRASAASARQNSKAIREQNTALKEAEARGQKLADIMGRYSDEPNAVERGENDKRDIDQFFVRIKNGVRTELKEVKVGDRLLTKADAAELKQRIDDGVRKPITMALDEMEQEAGINSLILQGREAEAEVLREKYRLVKGIANELLPEEEERLRRNLAATKDQNRAIEQRNRLIDVQARVAGNFQNNVRDLIAAPFDPKNIESVARRMISDFQASIADKLSLQLFGGDAEQQARDRMTGALEGSADRLDTSADKLMDAAQAIIDSATQPPLPDVGFDLPDTLKPMDLLDVTETLRTGIETKRKAEDEEEITVTGRRPRRRDDDTNMTIEDRTNKNAREFANKLFGKNSPLSKAAGQLGTFLSGAQYAPVGLAAIQQVTGKKGNELGAIAGGGLGKAFLGQKGGLAEQGLTAISSSLGQFAGPLGSIAGSILGSFAADALGIGTPKTRSGYASIQTDQYGANGSAAAGGKRSEDRIKQAVTYADDVLSSLTNIAEKFGGTLRANTNLGTIGSQNDKFVFDSDGAGPAAGQKFSSIEEAQRAAIKNAIDKGVISGIRAGTQRLLQSGRELETALDRAVSFENVFKELKKRKDPVGAAIDDLNTEFEKLIGIFNEAGASAAEFADLEELYGLRRAEAIKDATNSTIDSLQSFIDGLTASADSPLSRRTAYTNAKTNVDAFRADIAAGKVVDTDKLIEALTNFQDTSAAINGSRSAFYNDFEQIVALAKAAQVNLTSGQSTTLPKSPFDPAVAGDIKSTATGVQQVNQTLQTGLQAIVRAVQDQSINGGDGSTNGASFAFLPSALAR